MIASAHHLCLPPKRATNPRVIDSTQERREKNRREATTGCIRDVPSYFGPRFVADCHGGGLNGVLPDKKHTSGCGRSKLATRASALSRHPRRETPWDASQSACREQAAYRKVGRWTRCNRNDDCVLTQTHPNKKAPSKSLLGTRIWKKGIQGRVKKREGGGGGGPRATERPFKYVASMVGTHCVTPCLPRSEQLP